MQARAVIVAFALASTSVASAADGFYLGATGGQLQVDENAPIIYVPAVIPPPILHPVCGGTATIQYGTWSGLQTLSGDTNAGTWVLGWRRGRFALEVAPGPDIALSDTLHLAPTSVTQPACTTTPTVTVTAIQSSQREYSVDSMTLAALYDFELVQRLRLQLRVQVASWDSTSYEAYDSSVFELSNGTNVTTYTLSSSSSQAEADGTDFGFGIGLAYPLSERFDLRLTYQEQSYDRAETSGLTLSATFTF